MDVKIICCLLLFQTHQLEQLDLLFLSYLTWTFLQLCVGEENKKGPFWAKQFVGGVIDRQIDR